MTQEEHRSPKPDYTRVVCRYIRRNGKIIYPKNGGFFSFDVKDKK
jgi:hypothetical protein